MATHEEETEEDNLSREILQSPPYAPPPQFKLIDAPPLLPKVLSKNMELWLVRIQDSQLGPDDLRGKRVTLDMKSRDGRMGCIENAKGVNFEVLDLHNAAVVQPFAFLPKGDTCLEVRKISRQLAIARSLDPVVLSSSGTRADQAQVNGHTHSQVRHADSHMGSASVSTGVRGLSTVENLQEGEERILMQKLGKGHKKQKREQRSNSEIDLSPLKSSQKDSDVCQEEPKSRSDVSDSSLLTSPKKKMKAQKDLEKPEDVSDLSLPTSPKKKMSIQKDLEKPEKPHQKRKREKDPNSDMDLSVPQSSEKDSDARHKDHKLRSDVSDSSPVTLLKKEMEVKKDTKKSHKKQKREHHPDSLIDSSLPKLSQKDLDAGQEEGKLRSDVSDSVPLTSPKIDNKVRKEHRTPQKKSQKHKKSRQSAD